MEKVSVDKIVEISKGIVISRIKASTINKFCSDTRKINNNDLFISIKSESSDGLKYIEEALEKGAIGCITEYDIPEDLKIKYKNKLIIKVENIIQTIQDLAKYKRSLFNIPVVAVTGSVGKTSTKDMIATVLAEKYNVAKTAGNYNNHIGVPLTILNWDYDITAAVVEMGMNHLGEISVLTNIAKPTVAVITNIGTAHIGILGSRENILKAKLEILEGLDLKGKIIINNDNDLLNKVDIKKYKKITYGINNKSDYMPYDIVEKENNSQYKIKTSKNAKIIYVPMPGKHFIYNSLCAIAVGEELNIEIGKIIEGIKNFKITEKRNEVKEINNIKIINDYYNASFDSMKASLEVLNRINANRKIAILGNMLELGNFEEELHRKVGKEVAKNKINILITIGNLAQYIADEAKKQGIKEIYIFNNNLECIQDLNKIIKKGDAILLKASNAMKFGEISQKIEEEIYE